MSRQRRAILDDWVRALRAVRPELDERRAFAMVLGAAALITSWSLHRSLDEAAARELYERMAMAALLAR